MNLTKKNISVIWRGLKNKNKYKSTWLGWWNDSIKNSQVFMSENGGKKFFMKY
jgi:hypothetical protein